MDDLLADFLIETSEAVAEADQALLRLERAPGGRAALSLVFRLVHTIRGTCGCLGLPRLERVTHSAENVLGRVRDGALVVTPDLVTGILRALDRVKIIVAGLAATGAEPAGDDAGVIATLDALAEGASGADVLESLQDAGLVAALQRLSRLTSELKGGVMRARMQPIGHEWAKLPSLVRHLSEDFGKPEAGRITERVGGTTALASRPGHGSTFTTKLPTTLAIVPALIVEASGSRFAIPWASVIELVQAGDSRAGGCERIDGTPAPRLLPLVRLSDLLRLPRAGRTGTRACIVVTATGAGTVGIMVDRVFDTEDVVVKPVAPILRHAAMFSGSTTLDDGTVVLVLDPNGSDRATEVGAEPQARAPAVSRAATDRTA